MNKLTSSKWCNVNTGLLLIRIAVGIVFVAHGIAKFSNMEGTIGFFASLGLGAFMAWIVATIETVGGIALILGIWTRIAAIGLVAVMIGAITTAKWGRPFMGGYEFEFVLLVTNLAFVIAGGGKYALTKKRDVVDDSPSV